MSCVRRGSIAALLLLASVFVGMAQDSRLTEWLAVPSRQAGIVLLLDFPVSEATIYSEKFKEFKKWDPKVPFVWQLRVEPDIYQFRLPEGPLAGISVIAKQPAVLTYLSLSRYQGKDGDVGLNVVVSAGPPSSRLTGILEDAAKFGIPNVFSVTYVEGGNRILVLNTEPPWKIPPPPPKG